MRQNRFPNETDAYRKARNELLEAEAALREQTEKIAALRRKLPLGGVVKDDYVFDRLVGGEVRPVKLSELFSPGKDTLFLYGFMYGPNMKQACPLCTSFLDSLNGNAAHLSQRIDVAVAARSPIDRIAAFAKERGWNNLQMLSDAKNSFHTDYFAEDEKGNQWPIANVFVRREGKVYHFWGSELFFSDFEGGDRRHLDMLWPLWNILDLTPEGRTSDFYPALSYDR